MKTKHWRVVYKTSYGTGEGMVFGDTEAEARAIFALNFTGAMLISITEIAE